MCDAMPVRGSCPVCKVGAIVHIAVAVVVGASDDLERRPALESDDGRDRPAVECSADQAAVVVKIV